MEDLGKIKAGDSKSVVGQKLGISHYNLDNYDKDGYTAIYYYRVDERRVSRFEQPQKNNGKPEKNDFYIIIVRSTVMPGTFSNIVEIIIKQYLNVL